MQTIKVNSTRRNIGNAKCGNVWENVIKAGRKIIGSIYEPNTFHPGKYKITIRIAPGYVLTSEATTMPDAVLEFDRLTDGRYSFN